MALPAEVLRRWELAGGVTVEIIDLGAALLVIPARSGGVRAMLRKAIDDAGGYQWLTERVAAEEPSLA